MMRKVKSSYSLSGMPLFIVLVVLGLSLGFIAVHKFVPVDQKTNLRGSQRERGDRDRDIQPIDITVRTINTNDGNRGDSRYEIAPQPQRFWNVGPELPIRGSMYGNIDVSRAINIPTQGLPDAYQSMGILKKDNGEVVPLYGRRTGSRSDRFNYYTRTDTYNPIPIPVSYNGRDCQDRNGCSELSDGDQLTLSATGEKASTTLYRFDGPAYMPTIL